MLLIEGTPNSRAVTIFVRGGNKMVRGWVPSAPGLRHGLRGRVGAGFCITAVALVARLRALSAPNGKHVYTRPHSALTCFACSRISRPPIR